MLTREKIFSVVGKLWFENEPKYLEFLTKHLSIEGAKVWLLEHAVFADHFPRWFGNVVARCPHIEARRYMIENMYVEEVEDPTVKEGHYETLIKMGIALGLSREQITSHEPMPVTLMAINYWDNAGKTKPWLEGFAAICGIEISNNPELCAIYNVKSTSTGWAWRSLGLPEEALVHWKSAEAADTGEQGHSEEPIRILIEYARRPEDEDAVLQAISESYRVKRHRIDVIAEAAIRATIESKQKTIG
jgi:pyrroloquinoline-quinone synthase